MRGAVRGRRLPEGARGRGALVIGDSLAGDRWQPPASAAPLDASLLAVYRAAIEVLDGRLGR